jgi:hypothetical protein
MIRRQLLAILVTSKRLANTVFLCMFYIEAIFLNGPCWYDTYPDVVHRHSVLNFDRAVQATTNTNVVQVFYYGQCVIKSVAKLPPAGKLARTNGKHLLHQPAWPILRKYFDDSRQRSCKVWKCRWHACSFRNRIAGAGFAMTRHILEREALRRQVQRSLWCLPCSTICSGWFGSIYYIGK